jgi:hypothetical protein
MDISDETRKIESIFEKIEETRNDEEIQFLNNLQLEEFEFNKRISSVRALLRNFINDSLIFVANEVINYKKDRTYCGSIIFSEALKREINQTVLSFPPFSYREKFLSRQSKRYDLVNALFNEAQGTICSTVNEEREVKKSNSDIVIKREYVPTREDLNCVVKFQQNGEQLVNDFPSPSIQIAHVVAINMCNTASSTPLIIENFKCDIKCTRKRSLFSSKSIL